MSSDDNKTSESASGNRTDPTDGFVDDTDSLSEDERDLILAQLYHSSATISTSKPNTLPREKQTNGLSENKGKIGIDDAEGDIPPTTAGTLSKTKRKMTFGEYLDSQAAVPSTKFTFELDLDNLPPPPKPTTVDEVPSFDEEEDDDEEFAFRARGRYFAPPVSNAPSPTPIICFRCNQPGHVRANCTHLVCRECGALDSHPTHRCPTRRYCPNCSQMGHNRNDCPFTHNEDPSRPCTMCGDRCHVAATCHQIWRYYRPMHPGELQPVDDIERYCYNCAGAGHLGDDCTKPRPWYVQGGKIGVVVSAFGEGNVPDWAKLGNSPPKRSKSGKSAKRKANVVEEEEPEEDDDGWFGERLRENNRERERQKGPPKHPQRSLQREAIANAAESRRKSPPQSYVQSYRPQPPDLARDRSPLVDSYRPDYRSRDRAQKNERDWDARANHWRRERDLDRLGPRR